MNKKIKKHIVKLIVAVIVLLIFFRWINVWDSFEIMKEVTWSYLLLAFIVYALSQVVRAWRFYVISVSLRKRINIGRNILAHFIAPVVGRLTPGRIGEAVKILLIGSDKKTLGFCFIFEKIMDLLVLLVIVFAFIINIQQMVKVYLIVIVIFIGIIIVAFNFDRILNLGLKIISKGKVLEKGWFRKNLSKIRAVAYIRLFLLTVVIWVMNFLTAYLIVFSIGESINFILISLILAASILMAVVSGIPGGFGVREFSLAFLLGSFAGFTESAAGAYAILFTLLILTTESIMAGISYPLMKILYKNKKA